jgi:3-oxoacyl-[acyl-carrier-protein] synthase-3
MSRRLATPVGILALGAFHPPREVRNEDLTASLETSDAWIASRTGIRARRWVEPGVGTSDLVVPALREALAVRGVGPDDLDAIVVATVTPDTMFPATACRVQHAIGARRAYGFDLSGACSGFLYALTVGATMVASGTHARVAVCGGDVMSGIVDPTDRATRVLFGDGAGVALVERVEEGLGLLDFEHRIDGAGGDMLFMPAGGSRMPATAETVAARAHFVHQQGSEVFKAAVVEMAAAARLMLDRNGLRPEDVALFVPHQANLRIMDAARERLGLPPEKMLVNLDRYGNTTAATIPTALREAAALGRLRRGDIVVLAAFGAGYTSGAALLRWAY